MRRSLVWSTAMLVAMRERGANDMPDAISVQFAGGACRATRRASTTVFLLRVAHRRGVEIDPALRQATGHAFIVDVATARGILQGPQHQAANRTDGLRRHAEEPDRDLIADEVSGVDADDLGAELERAAVDRQDDADALAHRERQRADQACAGSRQVIDRERDASLACDDGHGERRIDARLDALLVDLRRGRALAHAPIVRRIATSARVSVFLRWLEGDL